jgi:TPR repeat protein
LINFFVQKTLSLSELENYTEAELENIIIEQKSDDARYILGRLLIEGSSEKVKKNEVKGINWLKEAIKNGHMLSLEYKTYHEIRFDNQPKLNKILKNLEIIAEKTKSSRACNTMGEFYQV